MITFLLNSGHGKNTKGKRSPFIPPGILEYESNIVIVKHIINFAASFGIKAIHLDPEIEAIKLSVITKRANDFYLKDKNCIFLSVHSNAIGIGTKWETKASGSSVIVSNNASKISKKFAYILAPKISEAAFFKNRGVLTRGLYVLKHVKCPAVLTENGFMTHPDDATKLASDYWRKKIARGHVHAMVEYIDRLKQYGK